jgi:hypothetical protein
MLPTSPPAVQREGYTLLSPEEVLRAEPVGV